LSESQRPFAEQLRSRTAPSGPFLARPVEGRPGWVRCLACGHRCPIAPGREGVCHVRWNDGGTLRVPRGYVSGLACDPIEKKPFFHVDPGGLALSFGMLGCDLHCSYCQNWDISQLGRDPRASTSFREIEPDAIVAAALRFGAGSVVSTYNEPLITAEWAVEIFRLARAKGLATGFVSNGNATPEVLDFLEPQIDFIKVDLKGFDEALYRRLGGELGNVLESIREIVRRGIWCEVVTLVVPGLNDSDDELRRLAGFLAELSPDLPWHCTAFHPDYRMEDRRRTSGADLQRAVAAGRQAGLRHVYSGNLPGAIGDGENTICPGCGDCLVRRCGFEVEELRIGEDGSCPRCGVVVPGRWRRRTRPGATR
jgi:pyruvate formate lyase activating enzyme